MTDKTDRTVEATPRSEYQRRQMARRAEVRLHDRWESLAGNARVVAFLALAAVIYAAIRAGHLLLPWLLLTLAAFAAAIVWHRFVVRALRRAQRAARYYDTVLARLDDRWMGIGPSGERYSHPEHLCAEDLDLFGHGSLFQLLCTARTRMGQARLAAWLLESAGPETLHARQTAVKELRRNLDLREQMAVLDSRIKTELDPQSLLAWIARPPMLCGLDPAAAGYRLRARGCRHVRRLGGLRHEPGMVSVWSLSWSGGAVGQHAAAVTRCDETLRHGAGRAGTPASGAPDHGGPAVCRPAATRADGAVTCWRATSLAADRPACPACGILGNSSPQPVRCPVCVCADASRPHRLRDRVAGGWATRRPWRGRLEAVGNFEALCSFSGYAFEHPEQPFPDIVETGPRLVAMGLGHPLIPASRRVANDVSLGTPTQLLLVSGSNMSGKSTLLRTIGINAVLALAGGPFCAARMQVSRLAIASAMRKVDSLQQGVSAFYAEIQRLRGIRDLAADPTPVLFLLDEILHGTNSHDRRVGAEAVIANLLDQGAIGLITTDDLALAEIADRLEPRAANVHFEDQLVDGRMTFDYRLRPGVIPKGNGLVLDASAGVQGVGSP